MPTKRIYLRTTDGYRLTARHTSVTKPKAVVMWLHGITVNKDEYLNFFKDGAEILASHDIDSLRFDFRGHGQNNSRSTAFSITGQMLDVAAARSYLRRHYNRPIPLVLMGCSFGAPPALMSAAIEPGEVASVVLMSPVLSYVRTFLEPETEWARELFNPQSLERLRRTNKLRFNRHFAISSGLVEEMRLIAPLSFIPRVQAPIIIIHGKRDSMVPFKVSSEASRENPGVRLIAFPTMDHGFNEEGDDDGTSMKSLENRRIIYQTLVEAAL